MYTYSLGHPDKVNTYTFKSLTEAIYGCSKAQYLERKHSGHDAIGYIYHNRELVARFIDGKLVMED